jgi:nucleotide-binding universal stress UspA family protein
MTYATLLAALTAGRGNEAVLRVARRLSERFDAKVIGLAACRPVEVVYPNHPFPAACFDADRRQIQRELAAAEQEFRSCFAGCAERLEWRARTTLLPLAVLATQEALSADLVVVQREPHPAPLDSTREMDLADLVMLCGRPVLLVPPTAAARFDRVLLAWKRTREAERAATDALPLLAGAQRVTVVGIAAPDKLGEARADLDQVARWLGQHGIAAEKHLETPARSTAAQLEAIADRLDADLTVAGAYGYRRGQSWALGGVTSAVLDGGKRCVLLSH